MEELILVVEDDPAIRNNVVELLVEEGFSVVFAENGADGIALAKGREPSLIICDIMMQGVDGYGVLRAIREHVTTSRIPFIFLTAKAERADIRLGMNLGADDYLTKPFTMSELLEAVRIRLKRVEQLGGPASGRVTPVPRRPSAPSIELGEGVVVNDFRMRTLYDQAARAAASQINILILGETGVGQARLARSVHNLSPRRDGAFLALNCAALTETLLEAELFGHEKGVFTGAVQARAGLLESATGGTVFLDEVGDLPPSIQTKLLRVLEERKVMRVGARTPRAVDVRFVAATNKDLESASTQGSFRQDLYYRLNGISFTIPPLRERRSEIAALSRMFLERAQVDLGCPGALELSPSALQLLESYVWPGNVRELKNAIERAVVLCQTDRLLPEHLPPKVQGAVQHQDPNTDPSYDDPRVRLHRQMAELERQRIIEALEQTAGNQTQAAELLGVSRRTLVYRLNTLGLPRPRGRRA